MIEPVYKDMEGQPGPVPYAPWRIHFRGWDANIQPDSGGLVDIGFETHEDFHNIVKRLGLYASERQVKLAISALENEMARRSV